MNKIITSIVALVTITFIVIGQVQVLAAGNQPNCDEIGKRLTPKDPEYRPDLDKENDGVACEQFPPSNDGQQNPPTSSTAGQTCPEIGHRVYKGDSDYRDDLDRDGDGVGCDNQPDKAKTGADNQSGQVQVNASFKNVKTKLTVVTYKWNKSNVSSQLAKKYQNH